MLGIKAIRTKVRDRIPGGRQLWFYGLTIKWFGIGIVRAKEPRSGIGCLECGHDTTYHDPLGGCHAKACRDSPRNCHPEDLESPYVGPMASQPVLASCFFERDGKVWFGCPPGHDHDQDTGLCVDPGCPVHEVIRKSSFGNEGGAR